MDYNDEGNDNYYQDYQSQDNYSTFDFKDSCHASQATKFPQKTYYITVTGKEAVNFVLLSNILKESLESKLGPFLSHCAKICLVFGVANVVPIKDSSYLRLFECFSFIKSVFRKMFKGIDYHQEGIEFMFSSSAVKTLVKIIKHVISDQGKDSENIHICIKFWVSDDMLRNNHVLNYNDDHGNDAMSFS